ncbi:MAG: hypothetical protein WD029_07490 [Microthrixaceae bacterium]
MVDYLLLAHQGGWDEILMVIVPVAVFGALLYLANRRADKLATDSSRPDSSRPDSSGPDSSRPDNSRPDSNTNAAQGAPANSTLKNPRGGPL